MTQPKVTITETDGALGVLPPSAGRLVAFVGPSSAGAFETPATYAKVKDITAAFGKGRNAEAAAHFVSQTGNPVVIVRTNAATAASVSAVTKTGTGTSVATIAASPTPNDDYEYLIKVITGGTIGVAGIQYQVSYDNGRNFDPLASLGTANTLAVEGTTFNFGAGTMVAGDTYAAVATAASPSAANLLTALNVLGLSTVNWEQVVATGTVDGSAFDNLESFITGLAASGKDRNWLATTRMPTPGETEAAYKTALDGIFGGKSTKYGALCAGAGKLTSNISGRNYRRPFLFAFATAQGAVTEEVDVADINLGALPGFAIRDVNGNVDEHDESANPGLDDSRFCVARTWDAYPGVYVNRPRLFGLDGSDYQLVPHRRVMNLTHLVLRAYFARRLNKPVRVDAATGFILETEAREIEAGATGAMRAALLAKPKASAVMFVLSRTDNILSTKTLTGTGRVVPLGYPEFFNIDDSFYNPALAVQKV